MPCGFCGLSNVPACQQLYITKHGRGQARSECLHAHDFQYKVSLVSTVSTPCTNTPIICTIPGCAGEVGQGLKTAVWKYNMPEHIRTCHPGYASDHTEEGVHMQDLLNTASITRLEEQRIGIPQDMIPYKPEPPSGVDLSAHSSKQSRRISGKRAAPSLATVLPPSKRLRRS